MQKTRLGITIGLAGAALYFLGFVSFIPAFLLAAYVLLFETNDWLKYQAVKMIGVVLFFGVLGAGIDCIDYVINILDIILHWISEDIRLSLPLNLTSILNQVLSLIRTLVLLLMGVRALALQPVGFGPVDRLLKKHM